LRRGGPALGVDGPRDDPTRRAGGREGSGSGVKVAGGDPAVEDDGVMLGGEAQGIVRIRQRRRPRTGAGQGQSVGVATVSDAGTGAIIPQRGSPVLVCVEVIPSGSVVCSRPSVLISTVRWS